MAQVQYNRMIKPRKTCTRKNRLVRQEYHFCNSTIDFSREVTKKSEELLAIRCR